MNTETAVLILTIVVLAIVAWVLINQRRSRELQNRFGPEYEHEVHAQGSRGRAEGELKRRAKRVDKLNLVALPPTDRIRYRQKWNEQQSHFVDDPEAAVGEADHLVSEVMERRGYPVGEFEQRAADISVDHPRVVENYRIAHHIAMLVDRGKAGTEDLRKAMIHYRALFDDLLDDRLAEAR